MSNATNKGAGVDPSVLTEFPTVSVEDQLKALQNMVLQLTEQNRALVEARRASLEDDNASERQATSKERFGIIIDEGHDAFDVPEVPVQVNGRAYQIKRGQYVEVPREVISVLNDAVIDRAIAAFDANGMPNGIKTRPSRRFPFQEFGLAINADGERVRQPQPSVA